jgi:hypothetical protein
VHFADFENQQAISKPKSIGANNNLHGILDVARSAGHDACDGSGSDD